jgi:hypothetical protein
LRRRMTEDLIRRALTENRTVQAVYHNVQSLKHRIPQVGGRSPRPNRYRNRADARGWGAFAPSEPRTHVRGHVVCRGYSGHGGGRWRDRGRDHASSDRGPDGVTANLARQCDRFSVMHPCLHCGGTRRLC